MSDIKEAVSFADFSAHYPEKQETELVTSYTNYLIERRQNIAELIGISTEDLHHFLGGIALGSTFEEKEIKT
jgi:hypothetical protein